MNELETLRHEIDEIDRNLLILFSERIKKVKSVAVYKKANKIPPLQPHRWQEILQNLRNLASHEGIDPDFIHDIWDLLHNYALTIEKEIIG